MRYFMIFVAVVLMIVGAGRAQADVTTGFQQHLVLSAMKPSSIGSVTFTGQKLWTAETKGECSIGTLGLKNTLQGTTVTVEPSVGYVGGWYSGSDAVSTGTAFGIKRGPVAVKLSFDWFSNTAGGYRQHTKFWSHSAGYSAGAWTVGGIFQKVDRLEKVAPTLAYKGGAHWTVEGRWYRSLNEDPKLHKFVENGRLVLKIS
jgi:hypothetical protein